MDNTEDPLLEDQEKFIEEVDFLLGNFPKLKILITSRKQLGNLINAFEKVVQLRNLTRQNTLQLLFNNAPRKPDSNEINEVLEC